MKLRKLTYLILSSVVFGLAIGSCNKYNAPTSVWNPNQKYASGAVITGVLPASTAIAGVREITIVGQNFSADPDSDWVWFGTQRANIKRLSVGSPADTIVIYRPPNFGSSTLNVVIPAADSSVTIPYAMEAPFTTADLSAIPTFLVMDAGKGDTLWIGGYVSVPGCSLYKLSSDGTSLSRVRDTSYFKPKIGGVKTDFASTFIDLKVGPGGFLYASFNSSASNKIYQLDMDTTVPKVFAGVTSQQKTVGYFDFDANGDIYTGNTKGLYCIKTDGTSQTAGDFSGLTFGEVRVIKDADGNTYLYAITGTGTPAHFTTLSRSLISSVGNLGNHEVLYDISKDTGFTTSNALTSFNVGSDGSVVISVSGSSLTCSLYALDNGVLVSYYHDNILPNGIDQLIWGNDKYLYLSRGKTASATAVRFYRMGMAKEDGTPLNGAPYLGRGL
ncbi:MAG TPA: IPT/TIG domain-containing protein [Candidatus Acidoferrales bacterium]|nr:IPT/TIG domain-containing protein [Candidatus Acidoferrales bacterium]